MTPPVELSVSQFVELFNQTIDYAYPSVVISGELANFRVSKNRWVYFDLKDEYSTLKFFGNVYQLPGPLKDGLMLKVRAQPRLHNAYGFSLNVLHIQPEGEGSIKKAAELLKLKLETEGLFDETRKRHLPYPPSRIGLITSGQSAAYADFIKILNARWRGVEVDFVDVLVQGESAPAQIVGALEQLNEKLQPPEVLILIRGGGSPEDLLAFSDETVVRAVALSRIPTLVAIGHEIDVSLAELAADRRASTPSNAAELLVPDRAQSLREIHAQKNHLAQIAKHHIEIVAEQLSRHRTNLEEAVLQHINSANRQLVADRRLLNAYNPLAILKRGYAIVRNSNKQTVTSSSQVKVGEALNLQLAEGFIAANVSRIGRKG